MSATPEPTAPSAPPAAAPAASRHGHHGPFHSHCENCGTKLEGPWCHKCGQHDFEFHRSFWHVFLETLETLFHFEGKFFRNIATLLFRPGRLTAEFNAGKRAPQMPPFRLYIFTAFLFFLVMHVSTPPEAVVSVDGKNPSASPLDEYAYQEAWKELSREFKPEDWADAKKVQALEAGVRRVATRFGEKLKEVTEENGPPTPEQSQEMLARAIAAEKDAGDQPASNLSVQNNPKLEAWLNRLAERAADKEQRLVRAEKFFAALPKVMLVCLPFFAVFTRILFRKATDMVYLKHLVLALHFHTFIYLWQLLTKGASWLAALPGWGLENLATLLAGLWLVAYPFLMFRRLFGNSWKKTIVKTVALALAYGGLLTGTILATAALIFSL